LFLIAENSIIIASSLDRSAFLFRECQMSRDIVCGSLTQMRIRQRR
jgi:hypothetical protein